nr:putative reverse transcriptase domain-containing protein [Tanacetum cinerariifolium]
MPEAPPLPDYIPGPEYPEYLPPADEVFPAEEQPSPAAVSPTAESPGYIIDSDPEMDPEEEDGDDEKSEGDSIDYPTSRGDDDADDDGDDLSEDALHSSISASEDSDQTEPFEEGETAATPPSAYRVTARISVRPHIPMPFPLESKVERLLAIPTPPLSLVLPTSYPLPPFLMPLPIFTPLPPPPPIILPCTRASMVLIRSATPSTFILAPLSRTPPIGTPPLEGIPKADKPLQKRARFTTPTSGYEVGESSTAAAARQIRPALTVDDSRPRTVCPTRECTYKDYMNCEPLKFKGTEGVIGLTQWFERTESVFSISDCTTENQESDEIERYVGGLPEMIQGNVMSYEPKSMQKAIEFANDQMDQKLLGIADRQADNKRKNQGNRNQGNQNQAGNGNAVARAYGVGTAGRNLDVHVMIDKSEEKRLENVPIVQDFSEVFPEDLPGLPPTRQMEFQIDLIPGAAPIARAPYRLAPSEMKELSDQL